MAYRKCEHEECKCEQGGAGESEGGGILVCDSVIVLINWKQGREEECDFKWMRKSSGAWERYRRNDLILHSLKLQMAVWIVNMILVCSNNSRESYFIFKFLSKWHYNQEIKVICNFKQKKRKKKTNKKTSSLWGYSWFINVILIYLLFSLNLHYSYFITHYIERNDWWAKIWCYYKCTDQVII